MAKAKKVEAKAVETIETNVIPLPTLKNETLATTALTPSVPKPVRLSPEQLAIISEVRTGKGNILVRARAGTGKTFLLLQCLAVMNGLIAFMAFGNKIAREIKEKVADLGLDKRSYFDRVAGKNGVDVSTFHAFGWSIIRKLLPGIRLEGYGPDQAGFRKFDVIAERLNIPQPLRSCVFKAMTLAQDRGIGVLCSDKSREAWLDLAASYDLETALPENAPMLAQTLGLADDDWRDALLKYCLQLARKALVISLNMVTEKFTREVTTGRGKNRTTINAEEFTGVISFAEMLYLPLVWNMDKSKVWVFYDYVLVDEAQDSNPTRREMARRMLKTGGRMIWVGDDQQAIFAFTGADNNALDTIAKEFNCKIMPMTVTFRCGKAIVAEAAKLVPDYKAADTNPDGEVVWKSEADFHAMDMVPYREEGTSDAIICRNTKPLVELAYKLLARSVPCMVLGREIGKKLTDILERFAHIKTLPALITKLGEYKEREVAHFLAAKKENEAEALEDRVETLMAIIEAMPKGSRVEDLSAKIDALFEDVEKGEKPRKVQLMTAHKSKGLEFTRTFLWGNEKYIPSKYARTDEQLEQEKHLAYVSMTRAIHTEVFVQVAA